MKKDDEPANESFIVEYVSAGKSVKVTAIDPQSMREVSIVGSPRAARKALAQLAIRKLNYVLDRDKDDGET